MQSQKFSNLVQLNSESIGIKALDNEIVGYLNTEIDEKINLILSQAKKFMRISKRKTLKVDDLNNSLRFYNFSQQLGYDSYASADYEKIENVKGLWRPKQNIVDWEEYWTKPISSCPMKSFPHFHWFAIGGVRPDICENFIRNECNTSVKANNSSNNNNNNNLNNILSKSDEKTGNNSTFNNSGTTRPEGVIDTNSNPIHKADDSIKTTNQITNEPVIHNISKELQIFFENFKHRFNKEIRNTTNSSTNTELHLKPNFSISKEIKVSIEVLKTSPSVVELIPYIIEFLMSTWMNTTDIKVFLLIEYYLSAIVHNNAFFIEPYWHQIITMLLSFILLEIEVDALSFVENILKNKLAAVGLLRYIINKFSILYPQLIYQLSDVFKENLELFTCKQSTLWGAMLGIKMLGIVFVEDAMQKDVVNKIKWFVGDVNQANLHELVIEEEWSIDCMLTEEVTVSNIDCFYKEDVGKRIKMCICYVWNKMIKELEEYSVNIESNWRTDEKGEKCEEQKSRNSNRNKMNPIII